MFRRIRSKSTWKSASFFICELAKTYTVPMIKAVKILITLHICLINNIVPWHLCGKANSRAFVCKGSKFALWLTRRRWKQTMSPLKTNAHDCHFELTNLLLFLCKQSSNADKMLGHDLNTDHKHRFFNFRKVTGVLKERNWSDLFSAAYQNGDQYHDIGPLCPITSWICHLCDEVASGRMCQMLLSQYN